jgi:hypothetical protein
LQLVAASAQKKYDELTVKTTELPDNGFVLQQNYPNPATEQSRIEFVIAKSGVVSLALYNSAGQPVKDLFDGSLEKGSYSISADLTALSPGIYFYQMLFDGKEKTLKMIISK